jgi:hypothetical protein
MVAFDDWSDLITINYKGGAGGDFIAYLIEYSAYGIDEIRNAKAIEYNRYHGNYNVFGDRYLKSLSIYFQDKINTNQEIKLLYDELHNNNKLLVIENIRNYCLNNFKKEFNRVRINSFHCFQNDTPSFQEIFPKSNNFYIGSLNINFFLISNLFVFLKNGYQKDHFYDPDSNKYLMLDYKENEYESIELYVASQLAEVDFKQNLYNEQLIDIYQLFEQKVNYDYMFKPIFGDQFKLDQNKIDEYHYKNIKLLDRFGINYYDLMKTQNLPLLYHKLIKYSSQALKQIMVEENRIAKL